MRRDGGGAGLFDLGRCGLGDLEVEVGRLHFEAGTVGAQQNVREDRDRVSPFHHTVNVVQRLQKIGPLESNAHGMLPLSTVARRARLPPQRQLRVSRPTDRKDVDRQNGRNIA
ncbi:hypothetical protein D9M72_638750 [compost metagenome]